MAKQIQLTSRNNETWVHSVQKGKGNSIIIDIPLLF